MLTKGGSADIISEENKEGRCIRLTSSVGKEVKNGYYGHSLCRYRFADAISIRVFYLKWRCFGISKVVHQLNEEIRDKEIRLSRDNGEQ